MTAEMKSAIEQIARETIAKSAAWPGLHSDCAGSSRCLAAHPEEPVEPGEQGWDDFYGELRKRIKLDDEMSDELVDETSELYGARFKAEWAAQVKACK